MAARKIEIAITLIFYKIETLFFSSKLWFWGQGLLCLQCFIYAKTNKQDGTKMATVIY